MAASETCGLCGGTKYEHQDMNHEFDVDGRLVPKEKTPPKVIHRPVALDLVLRLLLVEKGILTSSEINGMEKQIRDQLAQAGRDAASTPESGAGG